jgi:hypothetical protein
LKEQGVLKQKSDSVGTGGETEEQERGVEERA